MTSLLLQALNELVEHKHGVERSRTCLRVELRGEPGIGLVADALIGTVVHIDEEFFPVSAKCLAINGIAMVL